MVPTTRPSYLAHNVVVVGSAWYIVTRKPEGAGCMKPLAT